MTQVHARALTSTQIASGTACSKKSAFCRRRRRGSTFNMLYTSPQASRLETAAKVRQKPPCQWSDHPREGEATRRAPKFHTHTVTHRANTNKRDLHGMRKATLRLGRSRQVWLPPDLLSIRLLTHSAKIMQRKRTSHAVTDGTHTPARASASLDDGRGGSE